MAHVAAFSFGHSVAQATRLPPATGDDNEVYPMRSNRWIAKEARGKERNSGADARARINGVHLAAKRSLKDFAVQLVIDVAGAATIFIYCSPRTTLFWQLLHYLAHRLTDKFFIRWRHPDTMLPHNWPRLLQNDQRKFFFRIDQKAMNGVACLPHLKHENNLGELVVSLGDRLIS